MKTNEIKNTEPDTEESEEIFTPCPNGEHQWMCDAHCGPDSGSEVLTCVKCGAVEVITYY